MRGSSSLGFGSFGVGVCTILGGKSRVRDVRQASWYLGVVHHHHPHRLLLHGHLHRLLLHHWRLLHLHGRRPCRCCHHPHRLVAHAVVVVRVSLGWAGWGIGMPAGELTRCGRHWVVTCCCCFPEQQPIRFSFVFGGLLLLPARAGRRPVRRTLLNRAPPMQEGKPRQKLQTQPGRHPARELRVEAAFCLKNYSNPVTSLGRASSGRCKGHVGHRVHLPCRLGERGWAPREQKYHPWAAWAEAEGVVGPRSRMAGTAFFLKFEIAGSSENRA